MAIFEKPLKKSGTYKNHFLKSGFFNKNDPFC